MLGNLIEKLFEQQSEFAVGYISFNSGSRGYISIESKKLQEDEDGDKEDEFEIQREIKKQWKHFSKQKLKSIKIQ